MDVHAPPVHHVTKLAIPAGIHRVGMYGLDAQTAIQAVEVVRPEYSSLLKSQPF